MEYDIEGVPQFKSPLARGLAYRIRAENLGTAFDSQLEAIDERIAELERRLTAARQALRAWVAIGGDAMHNPGCPEDDTCDCYIAECVNTALADDGQEEGDQKRIEELERRLAAAREALESVANAAFDSHYGTGLSLEYAREVNRKVEAALADDGQGKLL